MKSERQKRLSPSEKQAQMLAVIRKRHVSDRRPWLKHFGWAKDDPVYQEAMKLGLEYRRGKKSRK